MAEKKKKKQQVRGMPTTSIQSRMPSKAAKGQAGKKAVVAKPKKKYGTGVVGQLAKRRAERKAADKWTLGEKLTKSGRERGRRRRTMRKVEKVFKKGGKITTQRPDMKSKAAYKMGAEHKKALGKKQKIRKGAKEVLITKGGAYAKYEKKSKAAGSFRSAFKSKCAGGAKSFSWDGRSYSCAKAGSPKKSKAAKKPIARGGTPGSAEYGD
jgi:hypothetical protein